ncbi:hypothetical protein mvi_199 [Megavirus vitis]|uniref:Uncharacterized protein n=2 Tax=unclassified Megavirus TaxID=3068396 RepID=A0A2K9V7M3_9VIRU|nr:hypothetical protein c7_L233 [Megavirus courdo7]AUV58164.1 hypothetical protein [Bandra megavirus]AVL93559.1 hypothetical protein mvi_199 [Megavirus vitis]
MTYHYIITLNEDLNIDLIKNSLGNIRTECETIIDYYYLSNIIRIHLEYNKISGTIKISPRKIILVLENNLEYEDMIKIIVDQLLINIKIRQIKAYYIYYDKVIGKSTSKSLQFNIPTQ